MWRRKWRNGMAKMAIISGGIVAWARATDVRITLPVAVAVRQNRVVTTALYARTGSLRRAAGNNARRTPRVVLLSLGVPAWTRNACVDACGAHLTRFWWRLNLRDAGFAVNRVLLLRLTQLRCCCGVTSPCLLAAVSVPACLLRHRLYLVRQTAEHIPLWLLPRTALCWWLLVPQPLWTTWRCCRYPFTCAPAFVLYRVRAAIFLGLRRVSDAHGDLLATLLHGRALASRRRKERKEENKEERK